MQIHNSEQERRDSAQSPNAKRKNLITTVIMAIIAVAFFGFVYVANHSPTYIGVPHSVVVDGFEIIPGETTAAQLYDAGFQIADRSMYSLEVTKDGTPAGYTDFIPLDTKVEKSSYYYSLHLIKNHKSYAILSMINESSSDKTLGDTKVREISVFSFSKNMENASLEGIPTGELTKETLIAKAGEPSDETTSTSENGTRTVIEWSKGHYKMELELEENGTFYSFSSFYEKQ